MAPQQEEPKDRDETLPFFSTEEAEYFRELVKKDVAQYGMDLTFHPDHITSSDGGLFAYWNVAQDCRRSPRREWAKIVANHFAHLKTIDPKADFFKGMSPAQVKRRLFLDYFGKRGWKIEASEASFYLWLAAPGGDDVAFVESLLRVGLVALPGSYLGEPGKGFVRFALVPTPEDCKEAIARLENVS